MIRRLIVSRLYLICQPGFTNQVHTNIIIGVKLSAQGGKTHTGNFSSLIVKTKFIIKYYLFSITGRL